MTKKSCVLVLSFDILALLDGKLSNRVKVLRYLFMDILTKIKQAGLIGRGGACFPVAEKWQAVYNAPGNCKYIVCNASEGEPGMAKDGCIIEKYADRLIDGIKIAINFLSSGKQNNKFQTSAYLYINNKYYKKYYKKLNQSIGNSHIKIFVKPYDSGYIGGEESSLLNAIEGKRIEPRLKPPFPVSNGLWGCPTLINNVETFYNISLVANNEYKNFRFYTISGDCLYGKVYQLPADFTIQKILIKTNNLPDFPFFVQVGGNASGEILNSGQLKKAVGGGGSIAVFSLTKYKAKKILVNLIEFFANESCGQCAPCREGTGWAHKIVTRIYEGRGSLKDLDTLLTIARNMEGRTICVFADAAAWPIQSYITKFR
ncbi:MAG: NADH-ubiquinone oxidoreductase-F iron-sulfur binding region domain-containing protein, partial [Patescibacteria group bacterium]